MGEIKKGSFLMGNYKTMSFSNIKLQLLMYYINLYSLFKVRQCILF